MTVSLPHVVLLAASLPGCTTTPTPPGPVSATETVEAQCVPGASAVAFERSPGGVPEATPETVHTQGCRMRIVDGESAPITIAFRAPFYLPWLFLEIAKANVDVARRILNPYMPIAPRLIRVKGHQRTDCGLVIYANSITLTPGTVSIRLDGDELIVHALTEEAAAGVETGEMDRRVCSFEGRS